MNTRTAAGSKLLDTAESLMEVDKVVCLSATILCCTFGDKIPDPEGAYATLAKLLELLSQTERKLVGQHIEASLRMYREGMAKVR